MKQLLIIFAIVCNSLFSFSQDLPSSHVEYTYDDAGNRTGRTTVILKSPDKKEEKNSTDVTDSFGEGKIVIAPNPTSGSLFVNFIDIKLSDNMSLSIYDITGKIVLQQKVNSNQEVLDLSSNPSGTYILKIVSGKNTRDYKVIKE